MKIAAIPTKYAGVQFRSRLEARWAAFFDLLKWDWEYEPIDLDGYIPDFIISNHGTGRLFVEVKPTRIGDNIDDVIAKALDAGCDHIAVVGLDFRDYPPDFTDGGDIAIGTIASRNWRCSLDLGFDDGTWWTVLGDKCSGGAVDTGTAQRAHQLWRSAQNKVQWKGVKAVTRKPRARREFVWHKPYEPEPEPSSEVMTPGEVADAFAAMIRGIEGDA